MKTLLTHRLSQSEIMQLCASTQGEHNDNLKEELYQLTLDADRRVATNALWVFTHFSAVDNEWLYAKHDQLIDRCLKEKDTTKLRLMLNLLLRQPYTEEAIRTDFIDFCLTRLADTKSPYAVRAQCIKLAYVQMRYWPELLNELCQTLEMISCEHLSPGLRSAWRQVMKRIQKRQ
ncbi:hypothetical protein [Prevotella sp.]|uniref:hypothetical protein n=1 Tax=uncultured Prevotella sp. TaxID=159272 RepID=UPI0025E58651|nr:hypothetical protein [uncultured Prevotella sp.]